MTLYSLFKKQKIKKLGNGTKIYFKVASLTHTADPAQSFVCSGLKLVHAEFVHTPCSANPLPTDGTVTIVTANVIAIMARTIFMFISKV